MKIRRSILALVLLSSILCPPTRGRPPELCRLLLEARILPLLPKVRLPYWIAEPAGEPLAEYFYFTGFADDPRNYIPFFKRLSPVGIRTISIAYPSHSESKGLPLGGFTVPSLAD